MGPSSIQRATVPEYVLSTEHLHERPIENNHFSFCVSIGLKTQKAQGFNNNNSTWKKGLVAAESSYMLHYLHYRARDSPPHRTSLVAISTGLPSGKTVTVHPKLTRSSRPSNTRKSVRLIPMLRPISTATTVNHPPLLASPPAGYGKLVDLAPCWSAGLGCQGSAWSQHMHTAHQIYDRPSTMSYHSSYPQHEGGKAHLPHDLREDLLDGHLSLSTRL